MKVKVDEMPKEPKECPYSIENYGKYWCNYRKEDSRIECNDTNKCEWFIKEKT